MDFSCAIWWMSRTKASFSQLQLLEFEASHESFAFISWDRAIWRMSRTKDGFHSFNSWNSFSFLKIVQFERGLARKLRFHESRIRFECYIGLHETFFFPVNGASVPEKSWPACATGADVVALAWNCSRTARSLELMVTFSLLWWCCAIVFCMCCDALRIGTAASKRCVLQYCVAILLRFATQCMLCALELLHPSDVLYSTWWLVFS